MADRVAWNDGFARGGRQRMTRRRLLQGTAAALLVSPAQGLGLALPALARGRRLSRVRPTDPEWPSEAQWNQLGQAVGGRLVRLRSPLDACVADPAGDRCAAVLARLRNPDYLGDDPALAQSLGWVDAWTFRPSVHAVVAETAADVAAAVNFARERNLRLVVKGGGHSYHGTSNAPDSLLVWTRRMNAVSLHDGFVPRGCTDSPQPAVSVGAGALWGEVYRKVAVEAGRYVQGGGCLTVGVAGLVQSGGFGSFSRAFGTAAANLLEAEIVTADGAVRIANACSEPELFWALKGGGGGSFGVVTRLTLRTHPLPATFGAAFLTVRATSDEACRRLIGMVLDFYAERLHGPVWGEQIRVRPDNALAVEMVFQGLEQAGAEAAWRPFLAAITAAPHDFALEGDPLIAALPARSFWDPAVLRQLPGIVEADDRPGAPPENVYWAGNREEAGRVWHGYRSAWLPAALLAPEGRARLADALFAASRHWPVALHLNKGLAGAPAGVIAAARETAMNPAALDAFALAIAGAGGPPAWPGIAGHEPDVTRARSDAAAVARAMAPLEALLSAPASYVAESDFFEPRWQDAFWGGNYPRLLAVKDAYDPDGLFIVHHGVGSERWSADGFTRLE